MFGKKLFSTGKRKTAIARIWMEPGEGKIVINQRGIDQYFGGASSQIFAIKHPLELTDSLNKFNIYANVYGGGITGQADAVKHAIAKALLLLNPAFRAVLKKAAMLTRDPRKKERKKYGMKGARKRFQYSKR